MHYFLLFMGWFITYSLFYFISLDIALVPPGGEATPTHKIINYGVLFVLSFPIWWLAWKRFEKAFSGMPPQKAKNNYTTYCFALRNPALNYYLMTLKPFLLALGLNGILTLSHHHGGWKIFYIVNFFVLYLYALPFIFIKVGKLRKALKTKLIVDEAGIRLKKEDEVVAAIPYASIKHILVEEPALGVIIQGEDSTIYLGGQQAKGSSFYLVGMEQVFEKLKENAADKCRSVEAIKAELKTLAFKPFI